MVVGLLGVLIVSWPKLTLLGGDVGAREALGVAAALTAACGSAVALLLVRSLVHTEKTGTIVLWFSITATVVSFATIPFGWEVPTHHQAALLITAGICGGVAQLLMTEGYRYASVSTVAVRIHLAHPRHRGRVSRIRRRADGSHDRRWPIVVGAGLFIIWRERQLGIERAAARRAAARRSSSSRRSCPCRGRLAHGLCRDLVGREEALDRQFDSVTSRGVPNTVMVDRKDSTVSPIRRRSGTAISGSVSSACAGSRRRGAG